MDQAARLRAVLMVGLVVVVAVLATVITSGRALPGPTIGPAGTGRTVAPGEVGWIRLADAPVALTEVAAATHNGRIWVAGGLDGGGNAVARVLVFDPISGAWADGPKLAEPVHHAALVSDGETLYLIGGYVRAEFDRATDHVWSLSAGADHWVADRPLPAPRAAGAAAWSGSGQVMFGGGVAADGVSADVFVQEDHGWRRLAGLSEPREHLAASSIGAGSVTFLGGRRGGLDGNVATVDLVSAEGVVGRVEDVPTARGGVAAFAAGPLGDCLVGGEGPLGTFGNVECVGVIRLTTLPGLGVPRHGLGAVVLDERAYVVFGGPQPGLTVSAVVEVLALAQYH